MHVPTYVRACVRACLRIVRRSLAICMSGVGVRTCGHNGRICSMSSGYCDRSAWQGEPSLTGLDRCLLCLSFRSGPNTIRISHLEHQSRLYRCFPINGPCGSCRSQGLPGSREGKTSPPKQGQRCSQDLQRTPKSQRSATFASKVLSVFSDMILTHMKQPPPPPTLAP